MKDLTVCGDKNRQRNTLDSWHKAIYLFFFFLCGSHNGTI